MLSPKILEKHICEDQILEMADFMGEGGRLQLPLVGFGSLVYSFASTLNPKPKTQN